MVMIAEPILKAWQKAVGGKTSSLKAGKVKTLIMSPRGTVFTNTIAKQWADDYDHLVLISGRYEGIDARVGEILGAEEVSVGNYILTGGELPALTIVDSVSRQIPGVLGTLDSLEDDRLTCGVAYTRPEILVHKKKKYPVPVLLLNGNHAEIEKWRTVS
jgi:tRNA (guanine37-N1)-methyltransferase